MVNKKFQFNRFILDLPFFLSVNFIIFFKFIWSLKKSFKYYKNKKLIGYLTSNSISYTFYKILNLNFNLYKNGISKIIDFKDYNLNNLFHVSKNSVSLYSNFGIQITLIANFIFIISHFIFFKEISSYQNLILILMFLFSTLNYGNTFACQNYSPLSYVFFPIFIYSFLNEYYFFCSFILFFIFSFSFSIFIFSIIFLFLYPIFFNNLNLYLEFYKILIFPSIAVLIRLYSFLNLNFFLALNKILTFTGFLKKKSQFPKRPDVNIKNKTTIYFISLSFFFIVGFYFVNNYLIPFYSVIGLIILIINQIIFRFSDYENIITLIVSLAFIDISTNETSYWIFFLFFIISNPLPYLVRIGDKKNIFFSYRNISIFQPHNILIAEKKMDVLFSNVKKKSRIFFLFNKPLSQLNRNEFNGLIRLISLPIYCANKKEIMVFPNEHTKFIRPNFISQSIWCDDETKIDFILKYYRCEYLMFFNVIDKNIQVFIKKYYKFISEIKLKNIIKDPDQYFFRNDLDRLTISIYKKKNSI
jgi:hypothetical protein